MFHRDTYLGIPAFKDHRFPLQRDQSKTPCAMNQLVVQPDIPNQDEPELTWINVGIALAFILVDGSPFPSSSLIQVVFSISLGLGIEKSILVASIRCLIQLSVMVSRIHCI